MARGEPAKRFLAGELIVSQDTDDGAVLVWVCEWQGYAVSMVIGSRTQVGTLM